MTREELMQLAAPKAICEMSWDSIEFLFRPSNGVELLLRLDFDGMSRKIYDWITDDSPDAIPHQLRTPYASLLLEAIKREEFYREMDLARRAAIRDIDERRDDILREMFSTWPGISG